MTRKTESDAKYAGSGVPTEGAAAEAKRLAARRRFLLGGASSLPLIATLGTKEAWAASVAVCNSLGISKDDEYILQKLTDSDVNQGFAASLFCNPRKGRR